VIFDNIDHLPADLKKGFEIRLGDVIERHSGIRFLTSSKKELSFKSFAKLQAGVVEV
jgi:hypothetical protein